MITTIIVGGSVIFTLALAAAWAIRPDLRAWIERPKHRFQQAVQGYDRAQRSSSPAPPSASRPWVPVCMSVVPLPRRRLPRVPPSRPRTTAGA
jgi:hypothetical protein